MAEALCLVDSNILIRWIDADSPECSDITAALDALVHRRFLLCYTSQNLGEFWNACTRPLARNGLGLSRKRPTARQDSLRLAFVCCQMEFSCMKSGADCSSNIRFQAFRFTTLDWLQ